MLLMCLFCFYRSTMMLSIRKVIFNENVLSKFRCFLRNEVNFSKVDVPLPPKRPLTAFLLFCKENRSNILEVDSTLNMTEQAKILAKKWSNLGIQSRKKYEDIAREDIIMYAEAHKQYYEKLSDDQRNELTRIKAEQKESRRQLRLKKAIRQSGIPKQPLSAYATYFQQQAKNKKISSFSEFSKEIASRWHNMSEEEKKIYVDQSLVNKAQYAIEMKQWRDKLVEDGSTNLLKAYDNSKLTAKMPVPENESLISEDSKKRLRTSKLKKHPSVLS